jgi:hypothetical protein
VFMVPSVETTYISSSVVREVAQHGGNLSGLVHPAVAEALARKFATGTPPSLPEPQRKARSRRR